MSVLCPSPLGQMENLTGYQALPFWQTRTVSRELGKAARTIAHGSNKSLQYLLEEWRWELEQWISNQAGHQHHLRSFFKSLGPTSDMLSQNLWRWTWDLIFKSSSGDSFELVRCENLWPRLILQSNVLCCWWLTEGLWPCIESSSLYMMMFWIEGWNNEDEICGGCVCVCVQREKMRCRGCCWLTGCRVWCWVWDLIYEAQWVPSGYSKR